MKPNGFSFLLLFALCLALSALPSPSFADKRVALVIGNANYKNTPALANPANDASDVYQALKALGFDVKLELDADKRHMDLALAQFARESAGADAALFYFAGHGMQYQARNYIMPVDAELLDDVSLRYEMTSIDDVKAALDRSSGVRIIVLDACRNNPLAQSFARSIGGKMRDIPSVRGFAPIERAQGMVVVYATQPDDLAADGVDRNSPFSSAFLKEIKQPGLEIGTLFRRISEDVYKATSGRQSPEVSISMLPEYFLNQSETDQRVWARVRDGADADALRDFIARYPDSFYSPDAKARLALLDEMKRRGTAEQLEKLRQQANVDDAERLKRQQQESERIAAEAMAREKDLAAKLAAAEAEREKIAAQLAAQVKSQSDAEQRQKSDRAKADEDRKQQEAKLQAEIENQKTTASQLEKDQQLRDALAKEREKQKADDLAAAERERKAKEAADREVQAELDRAQALKTEIARLEQDAAHARANAQKATETQNPAPAATPPSNVGQGALALEQLALVQPIRTELRRLGCYFGADSEWSSPAMKLGLAKYAEHAKLASAPDTPSAALVEDLKRRQGRLCPSECTALEVEVEGKCLAKACGSGELLNRMGVCVARPEPKRQAVLRPHSVDNRHPKPKAVDPSKGHCFTFKGSHYCE